MSSSSNLAHKAICALKESGLVTDGLTIPFLVGIYHQKQPLNLFTHSCIAILIEDLIHNLNSHKFFLRTCSNINEYILSILSEADNDVTKPDSPYPHISNMQNIPILYFEEYFDISNPTVNSVSQHLYDKYRHNIQRELFSKMNGQWCHYTEEEKQLIVEL